MNRFDYVRPATVAEAVAAASEPGAAYLAAGTNLLDLMKGDIVAPRRGWSISRACRGSTASSGLPTAACASARWCAMPTSRMTRTSRSTIPAVAEALLSGASAQLRNAATVGGNLLQRTRCALFLRHGQRLQQTRARLGLRCAWRREPPARDPGLERGLHRHAPLRFLRAADGARCGRGDRRHGPGGAKSPLEALHRLPGDTPERESVLEPGELIVAVRLPPSARRFAAHARYLKVRERTSYAFAVRLGRGRASHQERHDRRGASRARRRRRQTVARASRRSAAHRLRAAGAAAFRRAAEAALADAKPSGDNAFKIELAQRVIVRALTLAAAGNAGAHAGAARLSLLFRRRRTPCLRSR